MTRFRTVLLAILAWGTAAAVGFVLNRGLTDPDGQLLGVANHTWTVIAWWTIFAILPLVLIVDACTIPQQDWWAAHTTKVGWIGVMAFVPAIGPLAYVTFVRARVAGRYERTFRRPARPRGAAAS